MEPRGPLGAQRAPGQAVRGAGTPGDLMLTCFSEPTVRTLEDGQRLAALHFLADEHLLPIIQSLTNHIFRTPPGHALRLRQMELFVPLISTRQAYSDRSRRMARCRRARIMSPHSAMTRSSCSARVPLLRVPHTNIFTVPNNKYFFLSITKVVSRFPRSQIFIEK